MVSPGARLGPYEIVAPLGKGGMGEVWRAKDARLGREVALKFLPADFADDPERHARFEREAKLLAALNHPNIAVLYGLEHLDGRHALVMELVEGDGLDARIRRGPIPVDEAIPISVQIAEALEAAHEKGIVHRDLKPANVRVRPDGTVKVLDFGLAKAWDEEAPDSDLAHSPTVTGHVTRAGVILGTAAYMSPEQARGKAVDKRADIWAFGCVLYEMLSGDQAFDGETVSDTLAAVLTKEPDLGRLPNEVPAHVRGLIARCLQKDPRQRLRDVGDARLELGRREGATPRSTAPSAPHPGRARWLTLLGAVVVVAFVAWRLALRPAPPTKPIVTGLARLTHGGRSDWPSWSPDGGLLAYSSDRTGNAEIYVRRGEGGQDIDITNDPAEDVQPAFSPDGATVAFVSTRSSRTGLIRIGGNFTRVRTYGGDLWVVPALGGQQRRLAENANFPAWRPDGSAVVYVSGPENRRSIVEVPAGGGPSRTVLASEQSSWEIARIACSPDGRWISLETDGGGIFLMPASGGSPHLLVQGVGHAWDSAGRLYFVGIEPQGGSRIELVEVSGDGRPARTEPVPISLMTAELLQLAVTRDGQRIAVPETEAARNVTRLPLQPGGGGPAGPEEQLTREREIDSYPSVSPDGRQIAFASDILGHSEVSVLDLQTRRRETVTLSGPDLGLLGPIWMPDGRQLLIGRLHAGGSLSTWIVAVDGSRQEELIQRTVQGTFAVSASPDGRRVAYVHRTNGVQQVFVIELASRRATQITDGAGDKFDTVFSPDGRWLAVTAVKDDAVQLFLVPATGGPMRQMTTGAERMRHPFFSPDGRWVYVQPSHRNICRLPFDGGKLEQVTRFPEANLFLEEPTLSPDGRYLYYCRESGGASLWLLSLAAGKPGA